MKKLRIIAVSLASASLLTAAGMGVASAATNDSNGNVGNSDIPRSVFMQERQDAVAEVLNTTPTNVQAAHKNHTLHQLISQAGLTKQTFDQKVKDQLTADLEAKGYSQDQITIALQHKQIVRLHHSAKQHKS